jgi:hypothetical protein
LVIPRIDSNDVEESPLTMGCTIALGLMSSDRKKLGPFATFLLA